MPTYPLPKLNSDSSALFLAHVIKKQSKPRKKNPITSVQMCAHMCFCVYGSYAFDWSSEIQRP